MNISELYEIYKQSGKISTDSRNIIKDCVFFALKGENFDGNKFAQNAINSGAKVAVISDKKFEIASKTILVNDTLETLQQLAHYHRKNLGIKILGITGTNGKTTTKELVFKVLSQKYKTFATQGNFNNHIGVPSTILSLTEEFEFAVVEMGANHINEIKELCQIVEPDLGIITNIGKAHLEGFGSIENLINTKLALFESVKSNKGIFLLNTNSQILEQRIKNYQSIIKYGNAEDSIVKVVEVFNEMFLRFVVEINGKNFEIKTQMVGKYNIDNVLAAITVGIVAEVPLDKIIDAVWNFKPNNNRSELRKTQKNMLVLDMYNANPTSMNAAIENFSEIELANKFLIIGDMLELGENEKNEHQQIIDLIKNKEFKNVFFVGKIFNSCSSPNDFKKFLNVDELIEYLKTNRLEGYNILLKASNGTGLKKCVEYL